jgi:hypothetical protein
MAILAHADRLSMGNTCQLPVLTRVAYGEMRKLAEIAGSRVSFLRTAARRVKFSGGSLFRTSAPFSTTRRLCPQDVHREETLSSCGALRLGCRVLSMSSAFRIDSE